MLPANVDAAVKVGVGKRKGPELLTGTAVAEILPRSKKI
jgi:hypothetical protein